MSCCDHQRQQADTICSFMAWTAIWKFIQNGKNTSCTTSQIASHCHDWPQLHLTPQLFGQLQPASLISKPCSVKLCMLVSSWLHHGHPRTLGDCHNPQNLLHLLGISEIKSCLKRPCTPFILEPLLVSLSGTLLCKELTCYLGVLSTKSPKTTLKTILMITYISPTLLPSL